MAATVRSQAYRLDIGSINNLDDLKQKLPPLLTSADEMFQTLFTDLQAVNDALGSSAFTVAQGGTGGTSFTPFALITGGTTATKPLQSLASVGLTGQVVTSNGPGVLPTFQAIPPQSAASVNAVPYAGNRKSFWAQRIDDNLTTTNTVGTPNTFAAFGTTTNIIDTTSTWIRCTTSTGINNSAGQRNSTLDGPLFSHQPTIVMHIRTDSSITGIRYWFGLFDNTGQTTNPGTSTTGVNTGNHVAFRYVDGTDTQWVGSVADGTTQAISANVAAIAVSTEYKLKIRMSSNLIANFSVNGGAEQSATLPSNAADTTAMTLAVYVFNNTNNAGTHRLDWAALYAEYN